MVFSSLSFLFLFLPSILIVYFLVYLTKNIRLMNLVLLLFSFIFIFWGSGKDTLILLTIMVINYFGGRRISKQNVKGMKTFTLVVCIILSIGMLFYFKYSSFFAENLSFVLGKFNISWEVPEFIRNILLPLGISFYTFQALSYSIDVYRGNVESTDSILDFSLYVAFFPQLIAGPIVRYVDIHKQLKSREINLDKVYSGATRFLMGLAKKVLLANNVAVAADGIFALNMTQIDTPLAWLGVLAYSLQIYLDFSAYSDMAIGLARIFGFELLENFNFPYVATSVQDFWRRWHISLSTWFKDYVYIPLGGNRKGERRTYINLLAIFFLSGLWHGANWTFVVWGLWHGMFLLIERTKIGKLIRKLPVFIRRIYVIIQFSIGWVLFRAENLEYAFRYIKRMFVFTRQYDALKIVWTQFYQNDIIIAAVLGILSSVGLFVMIKDRCMKKGGALEIAFQVCLIGVLLVVIAKLYSGGYNPFIYFRF